MANQPFALSQATSAIPTTERTDSRTSSLEVNLSESSVEWDLGPPLLARGTPQEAPGSCCGPRSLPATPPSQRSSDSAPGDQLVDGIGGHFPSLLPTRDSSLTVASEDATDRSASAPRARDEAPEAPDAEAVIGESSTTGDYVLLDTPQSDRFESRTSVRSVPRPRGRRTRALGPAHQLTPSPTPKRKRDSDSDSASPLFAPRPAKRPRIHARQAVEQQSEDDEDWEYVEVEAQEPGAGQAMRSIRQLTINLAASAGYPVGKPADEPSRG